MYPTIKSSFLLVALFLSGSLLTIQTLQEKLVLIDENAAKKPEGSCVTINCTYEFKENMKLLWFKNAVYNKTQGKFDGTIIYSSTEERPQVPEYSNRVKFFNNTSINKGNLHKNLCSLTINDLQINDSGNYSFRFIHEEKFMSDTIVLSVTKNPCKVHIEPLNSTVKEGDTVTLYCFTSTDCKFNPEWHDSHSGNSKFNSEWHDPRSGYSSNMRSSSTLQNGEKSNVLMLNVSWKDDGRILQCNIPKNKDECLVKSVTLSVKYAPKTTKLNETQKLKKVKEGTNVKIECYSQAHPNPIFKWFKHNREAYCQTGNALSWKAIKPGNSGVYYCQASNSYGKENSEHITIDVIYPPRRVSINSKSINIKKGDRLELNCLVEDSNPEVLDKDYHWFKDRKNITNQITNTLIIPSITQDHKGLYSCQAKNAAGMNSSESIDVSVSYAPENVEVSVLSVEELKEGSDLTLLCQAHSEPSVSKYKWEKYSGSGRQWTVDVGDGQKLILYSLKHYDSGHYICIATNDIGSNKSSPIYIRVKYRPNITITHNLTLLTQWYEDAPVYLSCSVHCYPPATSYAWYSTKDNTTALSTYQNYTLQPQNPGTYYCYAANEVGSSKSDSIKLYPKRLFPWRSVCVVILAFVICFVLIVVTTLLCRKVLIGKYLRRNGEGRSFFLSEIPTLFSAVSDLDISHSMRTSHDNDFNFNHPDPAAHPSAVRDIQAESFHQFSNIHTVYDTIQIPQAMQKEQKSEEDLNQITVNYANLKFADKNKPTESASSVAACSVIYAVVSKKNETIHDYENVSDVPNALWDSDSSEEEEEMNYTTVQFTKTTQPE